MAGAPLPGLWHIRNEAAGPWQHPGNPDEASCISEKLTP